MQRILRGGAACTDWRTGAGRGSDERRRGWAIEVMGGTGAAGRKKRTSWQGTTGDMAVGGALTMQRLLHGYCAPTVVQQLYGSRTEWTDRKRRDRSATEMRADAHEMRRDESRLRARSDGLAFACAMCSCAMCRCWCGCCAVAHAWHCPVRTTSSRQACASNTQHTTAI